jgi:putative CocE/NonD family hydrolase
MRGSAYPTQGVKVARNVFIPMTDGTRLAADLYMPESTESKQLPVVMEYIPYRKDLIPPGDPFYDYFPQHGYVMARVDVRGTGASEGSTSDEYMDQEQSDAYQTVEWLAAQPWCDGHVNMIGISYGGFSALQCAALAPPHLTSVIPMDFTDDRYVDDCHYVGGLLRMYYDAGFYGCFMTAWNALPPKAESLDGDWAAIWESHLHDNDPYMLQWLRHQTNDSYWRNGSVGYVADRVRCPVFMIGGWRDGYCNPPFRLYQKLNVPRKILIGPWNHNKPDQAIPGPRIDYLPIVLRWLDHWCKGVDTGLMDEPPIVVFMQRYDRPDPARLESSGSWRAEAGWPPPGLAEQTLYLGEGRLEERPGDSAVDAFDYVPAVGMTGGLWSAGAPFGLPGDQRRDEARSLVYTSAPLPEDVHVLGRPEAALEVASSAAVMGFVVRLCEVGPDGSSHLVTKGTLNATRRKSLADPAPCQEDEMMPLEIPLDTTGWTFSQGNRIRLSISSGDFPNVWPTPQPGVNRIFRGDGHASRIVLPVVGEQGSAAAPPFGLSEREAHVDLTPATRWETSENVLGGKARVSFEFPWPGDGFVTGEATVDSANPADASVRGRSMIQQQVAGQQIQSLSNMFLSSTATHFHLLIGLEIRVNGQPYYARHWTQSEKRHLL